MLVAVHSADPLEVWVFGDFQSPRLSPDEHWIQPIEASHLGERNHAAIVALVRALHGMPLAIELAASRVRSFAPAEMVNLLTAGGSGAGTATAGAHLALLARGGPRSGHDPRHASMAEVIAWSWRLLDAPAQRLLAALTLVAVDASAAGLAAVLDEPLAQVVVGLDGLVSHSLVRTVGAGAHDGTASADAPQRFDVVEPVREFVAQQCPVADQAALRARLRAWLIDWSTALGRAAAPARVAPELPTIHAALTGAMADGVPEDALALMLALRAYWDTDGLPGRIQTALAQALQATPNSPPALRSAAHELFAYLRFEAGFVAEALWHADAAVAAAGADPALRARALVRQAWVQIAGNRGEDEASDHPRRLLAQLRDALALARGCGDREAQALALQQLAVLTNHVLHDVATAEALLAESQSLWLLLGDKRKAYARLRNRAQCWVQQGRRDEAMQAYADCEQAARDSGDWVGQIDTLLSQAALLSDTRQWQASLQAYRRCVALCWQRWHRHGLAYALWNPPRPLAHLRQPEVAMRLMGFAATFWQSHFGPLGASDRHFVRRVRGLVRVQLGDARTEALWQQGTAMDLATAVVLTLERPLP